MFALLRGIGEKQLRVLSSEVSHLGEKIARSQGVVRNCVIWQLEREIIGYSVPYSLEQYKEKSILLLPHKRKLVNIVPFMYKSRLPANGVKPFHPNCPPGPTDPICPPASPPPLSPCRRRHHQSVFFRRSSKHAAICLLARRRHPLHPSSLMLLRVGQLQKPHDAAAASTAALPTFDVGQCPGGGAPAAVAATRTLSDVEWG